MKSFNQFILEAENKSLKSQIIPMNRETQINLNKAKKGQIGPNSPGVPQTTFKLVPVNIPLK